MIPYENILDSENLIAFTVSIYLLNITGINPSLLMSLSHKLKLDRKKGICVGETPAY